MKKTVNSICETIDEIKKGNEILRNDFIEQYMAFVVSSVSKATGRYVDADNSEELSIGLLAFNEAIDRYEISKGSFIHFSEIVIRSRVFDYLKKENRNSHISIDETNHELSSYESNFSGVEMREEISHFIISLKQYGITLQELVKKAPKHSDTKEKASQIGQKIFNHPVLLSEFERKRKIPIKAAAQYCGVSEKVIKSNKTYITAYILILKGSEESLKEYLNIKGGVADG